MGAEQLMVNSLIGSVTKNTYHYSSVASQKYPDLVFEYNNGIYVLECKVYNQNNQANYPKQILAEIIKNRKDFSNCSTCQSTQNKVYHGFIVDYDNCILTDLIKRLHSYYNRRDWNAFGKMYDCKYIFLYDRINSVLYYSDWSYNQFTNPSTYKAW